MSRTALIPALLAIGALFTPAAAQTSDGVWMVDARLRYEGFSQDGVADADASTLRARLGYETAQWRGWRALAEVEGVYHLNENFNDSVNGKVSRALVADPEVFEVNRLQASWAGDAGRRLVAGRQRIVLNNARFVGNVGFRQNEQTFDALRLDAKPFANAGLTYIYLDRVHRIFGDESAQGEWESDSHVAQADIGLPLGRASAYALLLDFQDAPAQSSQTYGVRWSHEWEASGVRPRLTLEAATQGDYRGNTTTFDLGYQSAEFGLRKGRWSLALGGERLEGDGVRGFSTPLATLHAFQGWADAFLTTPRDGIRDLYLGAVFSTPPWPGQSPATLTAVLHDFTDDDGGVRFGTEFDASARLAFNANLSLEAKATTFEGRDPRFADRDKFWLSLEYRD